MAAMAKLLMAWRSGGYSYIMAGWQWRISIWRNGNVNSNQCNGSQPVISMLENIMAQWHNNSNEIFNINGNNGVSWLNNIMSHIMSIMASYCNGY